jgi:hypothetical protein
MLPNPNKDPVPDASMDTVIDRPSGRPTDRNFVCVIGMRMQCPDGHCHAGQIRLVDDAVERAYADDLEAQLRAGLTAYSGEELEHRVAFWASALLVDNVLKGNTNKAAVAGNLVHKLMDYVPGILLLCELDHRSRALMNGEFYLIRSKGETIAEADIIIDQMIAETLAE